MNDTVSQWISVDIQIAEDFREVAMDYALALGGLAIVEQDDAFQVSYPLAADIHLLLQELTKFLRDLDPRSSLTHVVVDRENWNHNWQAFFKPTEITPRLIILPEWEDPRQFTQGIKIRIRPAMAFGTGTHETTQLCLELLDASIQGGERCLDVGTGSGILGITALQLGAAQVEALENDPFTRENIKDNLELNGITDGFDLQISETPVLHPPYDLLVVNIIKARLFPILPDFFNAVRPGGKVIVSGLLQEEDLETRTLLKDAPWQILQTPTKNEWIAYLCEAR